MVVTLNSRGLTPTMPRLAMRAATVLRAHLLAGLVQVKVIRASRRCRSSLVEADDLGVQIGPAHLARSGGRTWAARQR